MYMTIMLYQDSSSLAFRLSLIGISISFVNHRVVGSGSSGRNRTNVSRVDEKSDFTVHSQ